MMKQALIPLAAPLLLAAVASLVMDRQAVAQGSWGTVKGRVVFDGSAIPPRRELKVDKNEDHCLMNGKLYSEELVINPKNKGVRWVFVWLAPEQVGDKLKVHPDLQEIKEKIVVMDQPC